MFTNEHVSCFDHTYRKREKQVHKKKNLVIGLINGKMSFNPDPNKQAQEKNSSRNTKKINHPPLTCSKSTVIQTASQKHLGVILDSSLSFD